MNNPIQRLIISKPRNGRRPRSMQRVQQRSGLTSLEVFASATIVMSMIAVSSMLIIRSARISKETRLRLIALQEVANELHSNLALEPSEVTSEPKRWAPSELVSDFWPQAELERQLFQDESGEKIQITLFFDKKHEILPLRVVVWRRTETSSETEPASTGDQP